MPHTKILIDPDKFSQELKQNGGFWGLNGLKISKNLRTYWTVPGSDIEGRVALLDEMFYAASAVADAHPSLASAGLIRASFAKEMRIIGKVNLCWSTLQRIVGKQAGSNGKEIRAKTYMLSKPTGTLTLNNGGTINKAEHNYQLEAADPKHRPWGLANNVDALFKEWAESSTDLSFFDWAEQLPVTHQSRFVHSCLGNVAYLDTQQRAQYHVFLQNGRFFKANPAQPAFPNLFQTKALQTVFSKGGFAVWVMNQQLGFYSHTHIERMLHHSTSQSGARVLAAGEWAVYDGIPLYISHKTGHYRCDPVALRRPLLHMGSKGIDLTKVVVAIQNFLGTTVETRHYLAMELLSTGFQYSQCRNLNAKFKVTGCTTQQIAAGNKDKFMPQVLQIVRNRLNMSMTTVFDASDLV